MKPNFMKTLHYLLLFIMAVSLFNCKSKQGDPGPSGPALSGSINGIVSLTTANGTIAADLSGVTVKTNKGDSTTTNASGAWTLNESTGIYTITYSKQGYGTTTTNGYSFVGGGNSFINGTSLSQVPNFTSSITLDTMNSTSTRDRLVGVIMTITGQSQPEARNFFIYYSTDSGVSSTNYMGMTTASVLPTATSLTTNLSGSVLEAAGILQGQVVYIVVYPSSATAANSSKYVNESTGKTIYTALGQASNTQNIAVPQ
ncbi:MAG TPA: hypothetical protein VK750_00130 [Cytophagaceae bacterium]|jgi:hypothetical protein|nr:hypothetical protein [Cytophagaceae bacterium]